MIKGTRAFVAAAAVAAFLALTPGPAEARHERHRYRGGTYGFSFHYRSGHRYGYHGYGYSTRYRPHTYGWGHYRHRPYRVYVSPRYSCYRW